MQGRKRKTETPCIHFELYITLNHFLKKQAGENLHDLFNIDVHYISEQVCEQKYLGSSITFTDFEHLLQNCQFLFIRLCNNISVSM